MRLRVAEGRFQLPNSSMRIVGDTLMMSVRGGVRITGVVEVIAPAVLLEPRVAVPPNITALHTMPPTPECLPYFIEVTENTTNTIIISIVALLQNTGEVCASWYGLSELIRVRAVLLI